MPAINPPLSRALRMNILIWLRPIFLGSKGEILDPFVGRHEHIANLLQRFGEQFDAGDFQFQAQTSRGSPVAPAGRRHRSRYGGVGGSGTKLHPDGI